MKVYILYIEENKLDFNLELSLLYHPIIKKNKNKSYYLYGYASNKDILNKFLKIRNKSIFKVVKLDLSKHYLNSIKYRYQIKYYNYNYDITKVSLLSVGHEYIMTTRYWYDIIFNNMNLTVDSIKSIDLLKDKYKKALANLDLMKNIFVMNDSIQHYNYDTVPESILYNGENINERYNVGISLEMIPNELNIFIHLYKKTFVCL